MTDEAPETFAFTVLDKEIMFRVITPGQLLILTRLHERAEGQQNDSDPKVRLNAMRDLMKRYLDVIDSLIVNEEDRMFLEEKMLIGELDYQALMPVLHGNPPKKQQRKAAPKKAAKAAKATPTVASRGRTKR